MHSVSLAYTSSWTKDLFQELVLSTSFGYQSRSGLSQSGHLWTIPIIHLPCSSNRQYPELIVCESCRVLKVARYDFPAKLQEDKTGLDSDPDAWPRRPQRTLLSSDRAIWN